MRIASLKVFVAVVENGSFTAAYPEVSLELHIRMQLLALTNS